MAFPAATGEGNEKEEMKSATQTPADEGSLFKIYEGTRFTLEGVIMPRVRWLSGC